MVHREHKPRHSLGFTLVELLVVVAIIALLLSILLPSLSSAREQAKEKQCLANLHDLINGSFAYATADSSQVLIPVISTLRNSSDLSASRRAWGGKSGAIDIRRPEANQASGYPMFHTKNGFGPTRRPLNRYIFRNIGFRSDDDIANMTDIDARADERLDYPVFRCPSDVGYQSGLDGATGIFLYGGGGGTEIRDFKENGISMYDATGNSYCTDSLMTGIVGQVNDVVSWGSYLHKYSSFPAPAQQYVYLEGNAFYACFYNQHNLGNAAGTDDLEAYAFGWHGTAREHTAAYADGHAAPTLFEVVTDVNAANADGTVVHTGEFVKRGGTASDIVDFNGGVSGWTFGDAISFLVGGPGWVNHSQTVPPERIVY